MTPIETHRVATIGALVGHLDQGGTVLRLITPAHTTICHRIIGLINILLQLRGDMIQMDLVPALLQDLRRTVEHLIQLERTLKILKPLHRFHRMGLEETPGVIIMDSPVVIREVNLPVDRWGEIQVGVVD